MKPHKKAPGTKVGGVRNLHQEAPYLGKVESPRATHGKGSTQPTLFGVIGRTKMDPYMASVQDLVMDSKAPGSHPPPVMLDKMLLAHHENTERRIVGHPPATRYSGHVHGQVPYPGGLAGGH